jgi:hypothetical protein
MKAIVCGDCLDILPMLTESSVDCIVTDPPYELTSPHGKGKASGGFMGLKWDSTGITYNVDLWRECLRVLKPGGHAFIMAIPRNYHRVACAVEDAGFIINSPLMWLTAQGLPKALDISKAFDRRAFVEWLDGIPHGLMDEQKRMVVSAAVNGSIDANPNLAGREAKTSYQGGLVIPDNRKRQDEGARLLADLIARFWDGEGLPPGCRVKVGETQYAGGHTLKSHAPKFNGSHYAGGALYYEPEERVTSSPSTPLAQQWQGWKSPQLKPAYECLLFASKPLSEPTFAENVERWGTGAANIDAARIPVDFQEDRQHIQRQHSANAVYIGGAKPGDILPMYNEQGRFPANVLASEGCVLPPERMRFFNLDEWSRHHGILDVPKAGAREKSVGLDSTALTHVQLRPNLSEEVQGRVGRNLHPT